ncbi:sugar transferase [Bacillus mycoides]|uniref:sugar transferase n=1 Tax=Bacillus mycoides TaxID=1405 RepID=UPI000B4BBDD0|nr:sugar transferase [Bacillus mycoides]
MALMKVSEETVKKQELLAAEEVNQKWLYLFMKRLMDVVGALCGLIFLSPVFLIVALLIKLEDPKGPILFKQTRVGKNEQEFGMYKFRSMVTDAEEKLKDLLQHNEVSGAMFKMKDDPRVTKIGKFIRKTSIDELPQLLNVLKGEMSLVGPRPPLLREVKEYTQYDKQRLLVTPGCAGLWQVTERNSVGFKEMVELDLEYINKRSIIYDLKIIFKTIQIMIKSNGAS